MSKIIEALEKAKREGQLDTLVDTIDERATVSDVGIRPVLKKGAVGKVIDRSPHGPRTSRKGVEIPSEMLSGLDPHLEPLHNPMSEVCEQYRSLRSRLARAATGEGSQILAITSCAKGEGKSLSATNLALILAQDLEKRVLLVDADLRRPSIHELLGEPRSPGLADLLDGHGEAQIRETKFFGLCVITAGEAQGHPAELLAGTALRDFLFEQRTNFDYIIFDSPPLNPISDVGFLAEAVDWVVLVVRAYKTNKSLIKQSVANLPEGKLLGTLLNRAGAGQGGYRKGKYGYYGGYY